MAKLDPDKDRIFWELQSQFLDIIDRARSLEFWMLEAFGETEETTSYLDELQCIVIDATERFARLPTIQLRIANGQSPISADIMKMVDRSSENNQQKIPALQRSIQEIEREWK
jgi:hypothetical protein